MNTIRKILVPVDLSDTSLYTVLYALEFAKHHNSHIEIFYNSFVPLIYGESSYYGDGIGDDNAMMIAQAYQLENADACEKLGTFKAIVQEHIKNCDLEKVPVNYNFQFGDAITDINFEIEDGDFDMIISGIHDQHHPSKLVKNISEKLLRNAKIPVIVVPEQNEYKPIKNIAYTFDYHKHTVDEIEKFLNFIKPFEAKIHCVHIGDMLNEQQQMDYNIKPYFKDNDVIDFYLISKNVSLNKDLYQFIKDHNIDALGMHPHKTTIWGQLFGEDRLKSILQYTNVPIITVH